MRLITATRRSVEENTTRWLHAKLQELLGMFDWVLDQLLQLLLDALQTSDVLPVSRKKNYSQHLI